MIRSHDGRRKPQVLPRLHTTFGSEYCVLQSLLRRTVHHKAFLPLELPIPSEAVTVVISRPSAHQQVPRNTYVARSRASFPHPHFFTHGRTDGRFRYSRGICMVSVQIRRNLSQMNEPMNELHSARVDFSILLSLSVLHSTKIDWWLYFQEMGSSARWCTPERAKKRAS